MIGLVPPHPAPELPSTGVPSDIAHFHPGFLNVAKTIKIMGTSSKKRLFFFFSVVGICPDINRLGFCHLGVFLQVMFKITKKRHLPTPDDFLMGMDLLTIKFKYVALDDAS